MKKFLSHIKYYAMAGLALVFSGCELAGLELQQNEKYEYSVLDPKINMTAWEYMNQPRTDTLFNMMLRGIKYAGLEEEYKKPNRTFLLLTHLAIYRKNTNGTVNAASYFGFKKVDNKTATKWQDYPVEDVRKFLLYHIVDGAYSYDNLLPDNTEAVTLLNEADNKIRLRVVNDRYSQIRINEFTGTKRFVTVRTSNIQPTNGVIHVLDGFLEPGQL